MRMAVRAYIDSRLHAAWSKAKLILDIAPRIRRDSRLAPAEECTSWRTQEHASCIVSYIAKRDQLPCPQR